ncbi:MAG TPA: MBL fold metallo-hydrolase, partial [Herpetosiphonaceae bacterium]|nr:MBL fold metallo-hydrolase [Herpetosiphonaceae bacterium]
MPISYEILGGPGRDNAVFARVESGQSIRRCLFDCGEGCLAGLPFAEVKQIDYLLFSHLHMDHVGGFDSFFRATFNRPEPVMVWGPPETSRILHHRFRGFLWNLVAGQPGTWFVHDVSGEGQEAFRFEAGEAFATAHPAGAAAIGRTILATPELSIEALALDHGTTSLAYLLREPTRANVDPAALARLGLRPGPWLHALKAPAGQAATVEIDGARHDLGELRARLVVETPGDSLAYLTDFRLDEAAAERLAPWLAGCGTLICESQYRAADEELARRNFHMTATAAAGLARRAGAGRLVLFHLSDRYRGHEWAEMLAEARAIFPATSFADHWDIARA